MQDRPRIPESIHPMLHAYKKLLHAALGDTVHGIYLYGSVALGAFEPGRSDVDAITLLTRPLHPDELDRLRGVHVWLEREFEHGELMESMYIPIEDVGKTLPHLPEHPFYANKRLTLKGNYDINHVTWWTLKHRALCVDGPTPHDLPFDVEWEKVVGTMHYNLEHYWAGKASKRFLFFLDEWIEFSVLTLCRIHYTLDQRDLLSKNAAATHALQTLPPRWHPLIHEALRIREGSSKTSLYSSRRQRSQEAKEFVAFIRQLCIHFFNRS